MNVMVTGVTGQLGYEVKKVLEQKGDVVFAPTEQELDLTNKEKVTAYLRQVQPEAIVHCAAYTAVDKAEEDKEACAAINITATETLAKGAEAFGAKLLYVSTDYVFSGEGDTPWEPDDLRSPLNVYGFTKAGGESAVEDNCSRFFIVRTSWVFGRGNNFVKTILRLADTKDRITVVNDQTGSPTYAADLAVLLGDLIHTEQYGIYHGTNEGFCTFYDFAKEIVAQSGRTLVVEPTTTEAYGAPARRPHNSRLSKDCLDKAGLNRLPTWQDALARYLKEM